jgi:hypothetical protein
LTAALCQPSMLLSRAGSLDPRGGRSCALCRRLLGRPMSEYGGLCHGDGGHEGGGRCRRAFMLTILSAQCHGRPRGNTLERSGPRLRTGVMSSTLCTRPTFVPQSHENRSSIKPVPCNVPLVGSNAPSLRFLGVHNRPVANSAVRDRRTDSRFLVPRGTWASASRVSRSSASLTRVASAQIVSDVVHDGCFLDQVLDVLRSPGASRLTATTSSR